MSENKDQKKNYYDVLGVPKDATEEMIKKAYKKLAVKWHPDKHKTEAKKVDAEVKFKELGEAYATLSDPGKRRMYDLTDGDLDDIPEFDFDFEDVESGKMPFFTRRGGPGGSGRSAPPPPVFQQPDYNELFNNFLREQEKNFFENNPTFNPANLGDNHPFGKENPFANPFFTQNMPKFSFGQFNFPQPPNPFGSPSGSFTSSSTSTSSSSSSSTGEGSPSPSTPKSGSTATGFNQKESEKSHEKSHEKSEEKSEEKDLQIEFNVEFQLKDLLSGAKRKLTYKANIQPSSGTSGKGERIFIAEIPPGMKYGESLSYPGQGHYCPKTRKTGDLVIKITEPKVNKYPEYSREGNDLIHVKEVQLCDVLCGSPIYITHLDESEFSYTETEMIRDGGNRRLKGRGFQVSSSESRKGDMVVKYKIVYPPKIYTGQKAELLKSILPHEVYDSDSDSENDS